MFTQDSNGVVIMVVARHGDGQGSAVLLVNGDGEVEFNGVKFGLFVAVAQEPWVVASSRSPTRCDPGADVGVAQGVGLGQDCLNFCSGCQTQRSANPSNGVL